MISNPKILKHFNFQADVCRNMGSDFTGKLCDHLPELLGQESSTGSAIEHWQGEPDADALALRLCGALQSIVIANPDDPLAAIYPHGDHPNYNNLLKQALKSHDSELSKWLELPPQTNETGRAAALLPGLLEISRQGNLPIHLTEIGSSAGLNLQLDHFHYKFDDTHWGDERAPVSLKPELRAGIPNLSGDLQVASTLGCDIAPIDVNDDFQRLRLLSYIWPDQIHRVRRIKGAIELALKHQPRVLKMDAAEFVARQLETRPDNHAFVLMHSVVWQYLPETTKNSIENSLARHGAEAGSSNPIYWLRLEWHEADDTHARLMLDRWPDFETKTLANSCFHGNWIEFL